MVHHGVLFENLTFWVVHRSQKYGPFDYQFNIDLDGIEMLYQGDKFGECCSPEQFYADLKPYKIPLQVSKVATVVLGAILDSIHNGLTMQQRQLNIYEQLCSAEMTRYADQLVFRD